MRYGVDVNTLEKRTQAGLALNEVGRCGIVLNSPLVFDPYTRNPATGAFVVIDRASNTTVGAGMILEKDENGVHRDHWGDAAGALVQTRHGEVTTETKAARLGQKPATVLITGLTGTGKGTLAYALEKKLFEMGRAATVLYGAEPADRDFAGLGLHGRRPQ